jgi:hypothetical protein
LERNIPGGELLAETADLPIQFAMGATGIGKAVSDVAGAGNPVSDALDSARKYLTSITSAQSRDDAAEVSRLMEEAKGKGVWEEVKAGLKSFGVAPLDFLSQGAGSIAPIIAAGLLAPTVGGAAAISGGIGAVAGAGTIKGAIYDVTKQELEKLKVAPDIAEAIAQEAQSYGGENLDQIALGTALGALASYGGIEPAFARIVGAKIAQRVGATVAEETVKGLGRSGAKTLATEAGTEALQGGQEKLAGNVALQRQGMDVPTWEGVVGQGTLEGVIGGILGGPTGVYEAAVHNANLKQEGTPATEDGTTPIEDDIAAFTASPSKERYEALVSRLVNEYGIPESEAAKAALGELERADVRQQEAAEAAAKLPIPEGVVTPTPGAAGQTVSESPNAKVTAPKIDRATAEQQVTETFNNAAFDFTEDGEPLSVGAREAAIQMVVDGQDPYDAVGRAVEAEREGTLASVTPTPEAGTTTTLESSGASLETPETPITSSAVPTVEQIQAAPTVKARVSMANVALGDHLTTNAPTYSHVDPGVMTAATNMAAQRVANKKRKNDVDPVATLNKVLAEKGVSVTPRPPIFEGASALIPDAPLGTVLTVEGGAYGIKVADRPGATVPGQTVVTGRSGAPLRTLEAARDFANEITPPPPADVNLASSPDQTATSESTDQNRAVGAAHLPKRSTDISAALAGGVVPTIDVPSRNPLEVDAKPRFDLEAYRQTNEAEDAARKVEEAAQAEQEKERIAGIAKRYDRTRQDVNADNPSTFSRMDWFAAAGLHELEAAGKYYDGLAPSEQIQKRMQLARDAGIVKEGKSPPQVQTVLRKPWAELSPNQRAALAEGYGVSKAGVAARKKRVNRPWAALTPEEQAALISYIDKEPTGDTSAGKTATNAPVEEALVVDEALKARIAFGKALEEARSGAKITNEEYVSIRDSTGNQPKLLAAALDKKRVADASLAAENTKAKERHERAQMKLPASKRTPFVPKVGLAATEMQERVAGATRRDVLRGGVAAMLLGASDAVRAATLPRTTVKGNTKVQEALRSGSLQKVVEAVRDTSKNPAYREIARLMALGGMGDTTIAVSDFGGQALAVVGQTSTTTGNITIHKTTKGISGDTEETILHEALHSFLNRRYDSLNSYLAGNREEVGMSPQKADAFIERFQSMFMDFRKMMQSKHVELLEDTNDETIWASEAANSPDELFVRALTDPNLQAFLRTIDIKGNTITKPGQKSWWSTILDFLADLLGITREPTRSALDQLLDASTNVLRAAALDKPTGEYARKLNALDSAQERVQYEKVANAESTANEAMAAAASASTTAEVAEAAQAGANARTYNPFKGPMNRLMSSASATHLKRLLGAIPSSGIVEHFKRVKVSDKEWSTKGDKGWIDIPELESFGQDIEQPARGMKSSMVRAFTRKAKPFSKFVSKYGNKTIAAAMHSARGASFDVSTFNSLGDAYKNDPVMDYLTRALAQQNLSAEQTASFTAQRKKRMGEITKVWGNWTALGKQEGGQALYREIQQYYKDMYGLTRSALDTNIRTKRIDKEYQDRLIEAATLDRVQDPDYPSVPAELLPDVYFPYKRYGKFWVRVTEKAKKNDKREFHTFESAAERDRFVEKRAAQLGIKDKARDTGYFVTGNDISDLQAQNDFTANSAMLKAMFEIVDKATFTRADGTPLAGEELDIAIKKLKDSLYQTYLMTLPERSIRKQFIHAEGIPGYSEDVMRNFTTTATAYANQLPKIKYGALLDRKTEEARGRVKELPNDIRAKLETVISELSERAYYSLNPPDQSGFVTFVNNAAFLMLLSSVATAVVQTTSIPMRVLPNFVSRYGYKETFFMLAKYAPGWNTVGMTEKRPDGTVLHTAPTFVNAKLQGKKPVNGLDIAGAAKYMAEHDLFEENAVHATMENRKSEVSSSESTGRKAFAATIKALTASFSMAERMSREMTGLMAYELEFNKLVKGGMEAKAAHDMAVKSAVSSVHNALGDYSTYERPRYLKGDLARFAMLFKMYAVNTTMFFVRNTKTILRNDPNVTAKERVAAAHELAGVLLMSGVFSGMTGMPLYSTICAVIDALSDGDDDDDATPNDPYAASSADWRFRNWWLPRHFGAITLPGLDGKQHSLSSIMERGPVSELSGVNFASRTAYDNMWFREGRPGDSMTETVQNYLFDNFSPGLSTGFNMVAAVEDWSKGDIIRGFEKISPALVKGSFSAYRLGAEGSRTRAGDLMVNKEDIESFPLLMQVAGFQPTEVATAQQDRIQKDKLFDRKLDERERLVREFTRAQYSHDATQEEVLSAYEAMQEFSRKNAGDLKLIITADVLENSARSYLQRKNLTVNGRYVAPGQENFLRSERRAVE